MQKPNIVKLHIDERTEFRIRREAPWIFNKFADFGKETPNNGDLVAIYNKRNCLIGMGLYDAYSPISVRMLAKNANFSCEYFADCLTQALERRADAEIATRQTTGLRLLSGESEGLPGLVLDAYDQTWVLKVYTAVWVPYLHDLIDVIRSLCFTDKFPVPGAYTHQPTRLVLRFGHDIIDHFQKAGFGESSVVIGNDQQPYADFLENGATFRAQVFHGQKTGFFLDHRNHRTLIRSLSAGKKVLDLCCYTGGFSINAALGGATGVWSLDMDRRALELVQQHYELNANNAGIANCEHVPVRANMFEWLDRARQRTTRFDLIVADPPSFASSQAQIPNAEKSYIRLFSQAAQLLSPHGQLLCCSCSSHIGAEKFADIVEKALKHRTISAIDYTGLPADHIANFPEARYLKAWLVTVK